MTVDGDNATLEGLFILPIGACHVFWNGYGCLQDGLEWVVERRVAAESFSKFGSLLAGQCYGFTFLGCQGPLLGPGLQTVDALVKSAGAARVSPCVFTLCLTADYLIKP